MAYKSKEDKNAAQRRYVERNKESVYARNRKYYEDNKDKWKPYSEIKASKNPEWRRWGQIYTRHKLTMEDWHRIVEEQESVCAICKRTPNRFNVDHDHKCCPSGKSCSRCRRGFLCNGCNSALGNARENIEILKAMIDYIEKWHIDEA